MFLNQLFLINRGTNLILFKKKKNEIQNLQFQQLYFFIMVGTKAYNFDNLQWFSCEIVYRSINKNCTFKSQQKPKTNHKYFGDILVKQTEKVFHTYFKHNVFYRKGLLFTQHSFFGLSWNLILMKLQKLGSKGIDRSSMRQVSLVSFVKK